MKAQTEIFRVRAISAGLQREEGLQEVPETPLHSVELNGIEPSASRVRFC